MTEQQLEGVSIKIQTEIASDLFLELRDDLIGHIGATAIEVKRK